MFRWEVTMTRGRRACSEGLGKSPEEKCVLGRGGRKVCKEEESGGGDEDDVGFDLSHRFIEGGGVWV
jgi:hypothetical protein